MINILNVLKNFFKNYHIKKVNKFITKYSDIKKKYEKTLQEFGINLSDIITANFKDYYKILNISYTDNSKEIRNAYLNMMKQYHPDINKTEESEEKSKEINEAYSILKEQTTKSNYDALYKKGAKVKLENTTVHSISKNLINNYYNLREMDVININNKLRNAMTSEEARAALYEFADWKNRFKRAKDETFDQLFKYKKNFLKLYKTDKKLIKNKNEWKKDRLIEIGNQLKDLINADKNLRTAIENVSNEIEKEIGKEEEKIKEKLFSY